jgi:DoxX-like family
MTSSPTRLAGPTSTSRLTLRSYLAASAPFFVIFLGSIVLTFADIDATRVATVGYGYPAWVVVPQGVAKVLGLVAILSQRSQLLTGLAFAGFFYDTLLALGAHLVQQDLPNIALATAGALSTAAAYWAHQRRHRAR